MAVVRAPSPPPEERQSWRDQFLDAASRPTTRLTTDRIALFDVCGDPTIFEIRRVHISKLNEPTFSLQDTDLQWSVRKTYRNNVFHSLNHLSYFNYITFSLLTRLLSPTLSQYININSFFSHTPPFRRTDVVEFGNLVKSGVFKLIAYATSRIEEKTRSSPVDERGEMGSEDINSLEPFTTAPTRIPGTIYGYSISYERNHRHPGIKPGFYVTVRQVKTSSTHILLPRQRRVFILVLLFHSFSILTFVKIERPRPYQLLKYTPSYINNQPSGTGLKAISTRFGQLLQALLLDPTTMRQAGQTKNKETIRTTTTTTTTTTQLTT